MKKNNAKKITEVIAAILAIIIIVFIMYKFSTIKSNNGEIATVKYGLIIIVSIFVVIFGTMAIFKNNHNTNIKKNYQPRRFKYLDTFYYSRYIITAERSELVYYHLIQDIETGIIYSIYKTWTNAQLEVSRFKDPVLYYGNGIEKDDKRIEVNDEGTFWIKEEFPNYFKKNDQFYTFGEDTKVVYYTNKDDIETLRNNKIEIYVIQNMNHYYDISVLEKAIFINGVAEFDKK